jgi:predicted phage terminase large subunit-like protein
MTDVVKPFYISLPGRLELQAELCRRSLADFFRYSWHVLEPATPLVWNWHLQAIADHVQALLEGRIPKNNLAINVPPGSSKSRIVSVCTTPWRWIEKPEWRAIYTSANPRNVFRDSTYARRVIESDWYQGMFRPDWKFSDDQNTKSLFRNTKTGFRQAIGSGGAVTGDRANALFLDDMIDATQAESKAAREAFVVFYDQGFASRVSDAATSTRCMIAQRLHDSDPVGHVLKSGDWESLIIRQEYELEREKPRDNNSPMVPPKPTAIGWLDPRTKTGELMDPTRFGPVYIDGEKRRLGTRGYAAQHQQRPAPADGAILKRDWFQWYKTPRDANGDFLPPADRVKALGITRVIQAVDTALGTKESNDFTADITGGEAPSRFYLLDLFKERVDAPTGKAAIIGLQVKWNAQGVVIEGGSSASGKAAAQTIRAETRLPVIEMPVHTDKVVGMNMVSPTVESKVIYLPEDQPWAHDLLDSLLRFPVGEHDDDCDAFRILLQYCFYGGGGLGMLEFARRERAKAAATTESVTPSSNGDAPSANGAGSYTNGVERPKFPWQR